MIANAFQFQWEVDLMVFVQKHLMNSSLMNFLCVLFTYLGEPLTPVVIIIYLYWSYDKEFGKFIAYNTLPSCVINPMIKNIFFRLRPYMVNDSIKCLKALEEDADIYDVKAQGYSFPSGHAMNAACLYGSLYAYTKSKKVLFIAIVLTALVSFSRFALGVHYPTDVIVGALVGTIVIVVMSFVQRRFGGKKSAIILLIVFFIGFFYCKSDDFYSCYGTYLGVVLGVLFEEKYVNFKNTKNTLRGIVRFVIGGLLAVTLLEGLKYFINSLTITNVLVDYILRTFRYAITTFTVAGVYPMLFKKNIFKFKE